MTGTGTLRLVIRWPAEQGAYRVAVIPPSAQTIVLRVLRGTTVIKTVPAARPAGGNTTTVTTELAAANNLGIEASAYREKDPVPAGAKVIARGTAAGVNIVASKITTKSIVMDSTSVPSISLLSTNAAFPGAEVTITGANLEIAGTAMPSVKFGGVASTRVTPVGSTSLKSMVPAGAKSGRIVIASDGQTSSSNASFWVLSSLAIGADREQWDDGPAGARQIRYASTLACAAGAAYADGGELAGMGPPPATVWGIDDPTVGAIDSAGKFTAGRKNAKAEIQANIGVAAATLSVTPVGVDGISLDKTDLTLNALPAAGTPEAAFTTSATVVAALRSTLPDKAPFTRGIRWESSDESLATVSAGIVTAARDASDSTAVITARSRDDPDIVATASVKLTIFGDFKLEVQ